MDRDLRLKQFANALFSSVYREYNTTFELPVKLPNVFSQSEATGCSEEEKRAVLKLCVSFRSVFNGVFAKAFPQIQKSVKHFMTFLTSRCLKLCGDDLFLSFVIICAFISELNLFCCINGCYTFMSTAPRCLMAIFNRRLKREFYARGGWDRLKLFCDNFVQMNGRIMELDSLPEEQANGNPPNQNSVKKILQLLEENSSSDDDSTSSSESSSSSGEMAEDSEEEEEEECAEVEEKMSSEEESDSSESESSVDSEDSEAESLESGEIVIDRINRTTESEEESDSSEDSDPSSMTEEEASESESDDSQSDTAPNIEQTNCLTPIMQENLSIEKKIL